jgi:hypothetical protein
LVYASLPSTSAASSCPSLVESRPDPERPTVARITARGTCALPDAIEVEVTSVTGEPVAKRSVTALPGAIRQFELDLATVRPQSTRAGVYRLRWSVLTGAGTAAREHLFTVPCPPPPSVSALRRDSPPRVELDLAPGDQCQGDTTAVLEWLDDRGGVVSRTAPARQAAVSGGRLVLPLDGAQAPGAASARVTLRNATPVSRSVSVPLTSPGPVGADVAPRAARAGGRCEPPQVTTLAFDTSDPAQTHWIGRVVAQPGCHAALELALQLRDAENAVVFNRTLTPPAEGGTFRVPVQVVSGTTYVGTATLRYGPEPGQQTRHEQPLVATCDDPRVETVGYSRADGSALTAGLALSACHLPAVATIEIREAAGALVVSTARPLQTSGLLTFLEPYEIGALPAGDYTARVSVRDAHGRRAERSFAFVPDAEGPSVAFRVRGEPIARGTPVTVASLDDLTAIASDAAGVLPDAEPATATPPSAAPTVRGHVSRIAGERGAELFVSGVVHAATPELTPTAVLVSQGADLKRLPVARRFVAIEAAAATSEPRVWPIGFQAGVRTSSLAPGAYTVLGVVIRDASGDRLIATGGTFLVAPPSARRTNASLRHGLLDVPVEMQPDAGGVIRFRPRSALVDGSYSLEVIAVDRFGTSTPPQRFVFAVAQDKDTRLVGVPSLAGFTTSVQHRFTDVAPNATVRLLARRVEGRGTLQVGDRPIDDRTVELSVRADRTGTVSLPLTLVTGDVDGRFALQPDIPGGRPLELAVTAYAPEFRLRRQDGTSGAVLLVENDSAACPRHAVFAHLGEVDLAADDVLCALQVSSPGVVRLTSSGRTTALSLPNADPGTLKLDVGFVVRRDGRAEFRSVRVLTVAELEALSLTPRVAFESGSALRGRAGALLTRVGAFRPGELVVRTDAPDAIVEVAGRRTALADPGVHRLPVETHVAALAGTQTVAVRAYYAASPTQVAHVDLTFTAVPAPVQVEASGAQLVLPTPLTLDVRLSSDDGPYVAERHGKYRVKDAFVLRQRDPAARVINASATPGDAGQFRLTFPAAPAGQYRLYLALEPVAPSLAAVLPPVSASVPFAILDGRPLDARLFTFRASGTAPFVGRAQLQFGAVDAASDLANATWEISSDGAVFTPYQQGGTAVDVAIPTASSRWLRARLVNRHTQAESVTPPLQLSAFTSDAIAVSGPSQTFKGFPVTLTSRAQQPDAVLWRVTAPGSARVQELRGRAITLTPSAIGTYYLEVVADASVAGASARAAPRVFRTVAAHWPTVPPAIINGPRDVEPGRAATFSVRFPPLFPTGDNPTLKRVGEWVLPGGRTVPGEAPIAYTVEAPPPRGDTVDIVYRSWIEGARDATVSTAVHRLRPTAYRWPQWELAAETTSTAVPALHRIVVRPKVWRDWLSAPDLRLDTAWEVPPFARVRYRSDREVLLEVTQDRPFDVSARVTDARGNVSDLRLAAVEPVRRVQFEIATRITAERARRTAPLKVAVSADPVLLPKGLQVTRVAYYLDDEYVGATTGAPLQFVIERPGVHTVRAVASAGTEFVAQDSLSVEVGENLPPVCSIRAVGDFAINGVATAECDDPDGTMKAYRWYLNGQLITGAGSRVVIPRAQIADVDELSVVGVDSAGREGTARFAPPGAAS